MTERTKPPLDDRSAEGPAEESCRPLLAGHAAKASATLNPPAFDSGDGEEDGDPAEEVPGSLLQPKEYFAGRYYVVRMLALGGIAEVYEAVDMEAGKPCALKILRLQHRGSEKLRAQMAAEARALGEIEHPNMVKVWDAGVTASGLIYYAMELLTGATLHDVIHGAPDQPRPGPVPLRLALRWIAELSSVVHALHEGGIIHRDLKPDNVFVTLDGHIKVLDLGAAKFRRYGLRTTSAHKTIGTPPYMSPEHLRGDPTIDGRSDVYSLGHVFYELIAQEHAFYSPGANYSAETYRLWQQERRPAPLTEKRPGLPSVVSELVLQALEKRREDRWQTCEEMERAALGVADYLEQIGALEEPPPPAPMDPVARLAARTTAEALPGTERELPVVRVQPAAGSVRAPAAVPAPAPVRRTDRGTEILGTQGKAEIVSAPRRTDRGTEIVETSPARASSRSTPPPSRVETVPLPIAPADPKQKAVALLLERAKAHEQADARSHSPPLSEPRGSSLEVVTTDPAVPEAGDRRALPFSVRRKPRSLGAGIALLVGVAAVTGTVMFFVGRRWSAPAVSVQAEPGNVAVSGSPAQPSPLASADIPAASSASASTTASATTAASSDAPVVASATPAPSGDPAPVKTAAPRAVPPKTAVPARPAAPKPAPAKPAPSLEPEEKPRRTRLPTNPRPKSDRLPD